MGISRRWFAAGLTLVVGTALYVLVRPVSAPESAIPIPPLTPSVSETVAPIDEPVLSKSIAKEEPASKPVPAVSFPAAPEPFKATIQGSVSDALTREPLEEFQLLVKTGRFINYNPRKHRGFQTVRSPDGLFFINDIPARGVTVFVRAASYEPQLRYVAGLEVDTASTDLDFSLVPLASVRGKVTDKYGVPLAEVEIFPGDLAAAMKNRYDCVLTDVNGEYRLSKVSTDTSHVTALSLERGTQTNPVVTQHGEETVVNFMFDDVPAVSGRVRYGRESAPGIVLTLNGTEVRTTDFQGRFQFASAPVGACSIQLSDFPYFWYPEGSRREVTAIFDSALSVSVPRSFDRTPLDIDLSNVVSGVRLTVVRGGKPLTEWTAYFSIAGEGGLSQNGSAHNSGNESHFIRPLLAGTCSFVISSGETDALANSLSSVFVGAGNGEFIQLNLNRESLGFRLNRTVRTQIGTVTDLVIGIDTTKSKTALVPWDDAMNEHWPSSGNGPE